MISGWRDVLSFTLIQTLKSKSFIVSYLILLILVTATIPVIGYFSKSGEKDPNAASPIKKVYVSNETTLPDMDFSELKEETPFKNIAFETLTEDSKATSDRIEAEENTSVLLTISVANGQYSLSLVKSSKGPVGDSDLTQLGDAISKQFESYKINALGISEAQLAMLNATVDTSVSLLDAGGNTVVKETDSITLNEYWLVYGVCFILFMINAMAGAQIATSIVTEKSTRVMEYLLTSVKPLALIIGKIIAMLTAVLMQMISLVIMVFLSNVATSAFILGNGDNVLSQYLSSNIFANLNIGNILLCLLLILLGLIFYATLAGLAGATVSRMEELQEGLTLFTFTNIIGLYIAMAASATLMGDSSNGFAIFAYLFPISSPFLLPGAILIGKISLPLAAASIALLIVSNLLLCRFVAKIFESLILHNGNRIKIKELFKFAKTV
jgi:ABC-2 type transport system permease protein